MDPATVRSLAFCAAAAVSFAGATFVMKTFADAPSLRVGLVLALCVLVAVGFQVAALRTAPLGLVHVVVVAAHSLAVLAVLAFSTGGFDLQKLAGAGLMLFGVTVIAG